MEFLRPPEFIKNTAVPFALRACERFESQPVTGNYSTRKTNFPPLVV